MDRPLGYEEIGGKKVMPPWVRMCEIVPRAFQNACFAPTPQWSAELLGLCLQYWGNWPEHRDKGEGITLLGASGSGKSYAAAALANEILHAWGREQHVNIEWVSVPWAISELLDMKHFHMKEEFLSKKWWWYKADLLILDDIFQIPAGNSFNVTAEIIAIYHYRMENLLPTVITGNTDGDPWRVFEGVFNAPFARRVRDNCTGRTLILGEL